MNNISSHPHTRPILITAGVLLVVILAVLFAHKFSQPTTSATHTNTTRHFAVNRSRIQNIDTLLTAREVFVNTPTEQHDTAFVFKTRGKYTLAGHGITPSGGEFLEPATTLKLLDDTGTETLITDQPVEYSSLSADGQKTIYITPDKQTYLYDNTTKSNTLITTKAAFLPDLCSDNNQIVYKELPPNYSPGADYTNSRGLVKKNLTTGQETLLTTYTGGDDITNPEYSFIGENSYAPTFSPDCSSIIYFRGSTTGNIGGMFIMNSDGTNQTRLTNHNQKTKTADTIPSISDSPLWSPDGASFIYESGGKIMKADIDTKSRSLRSPVSKVADGIAPTWAQGQEGKSLEIRQKGQGAGQKIKREVIVTQ